MSVTKNLDDLVDDLADDHDDGDDESPDTPAVATPPGSAYPKVERHTAIAVTLTFGLPSDQAERKASMARIDANAKSAVEAAVAAALAEARGSPEAAQATRLRDLLADVDGQLVEQRQTAETARASWDAALNDQGGDWKKRHDQAQKKLADAEGSIATLTARQSALRAKFGEADAAYAGVRKAAVTEALNNFCARATVNREPARIAGEMNNLVAAVLEKLLTCYRSGELSQPQTLPYWLAKNPAY
jgi:hypothetical protein